MLKYSYLLAFSIVLFSLSACSSGKVAAPAQPNTRLQQAVASEPKKPRMKINHSVHILTYASASRDRCMSAFDEAGILLKKFYDGSQESLKQGLIENQENIHAELMKIKEKVQKNSAKTVPRLTQLLKSDDAFIANMEQAVAACDNSLLSLIDMVTSDTDVFPADGHVLPAEIVSERYNRIVNPQLIALEMLYTFEANEYADYDAWLSAQYQFVLMMQHVYKELQIVANAFFNNGALPDAAHYKAAQSSFVNLKANAKTELSMLSGMEMLLKLAAANAQKAEIETLKKKVNLQSEFDAVLADFEPSYITMLSELSKSDPDDDIVLESLNVLLVSVIGNELTRTRFRKQYMQRLLSTLDAAVKHKEQE